MSDFNDRITQVHVKILREKLRRNMTKRATIEKPDATIQERINILKNIMTERHIAAAGAPIGNIPSSEPASGNNPQPQKQYYPQQYQQGFCQQNQQPIPQQNQQMPFPQPIIYDINTGRRDYHRHHSGSTDADRPRRNHETLRREEYHNYIHDNGRPNNPDSSYGFNDTLKTLTMQNFQLQQMLLQNSLISQVNGTKKETVTEQKGKCESNVNEFTQTYGNSQDEIMSYPETFSDRAVRKSFTRAQLRVKFKAAIYAILFICFQKSYKSKATLPKRITKSMLVNSEKQAIKYVKKLGAFHDSIMSVATLSKEGTTFFAKESFLSFSLTPSKGDLGLIKNLCSVVDCIQQISFEQILTKYGYSSAVVQILKLIVTNPNKVPASFNWIPSSGMLAFDDEDEHDGVALSDDAFVDITNPIIKISVVYFIIIHILLVKMLTKPVEAGLISKANGNVVRNLRVLSIVIYYIAYSICNPAASQKPPANFVSILCPEFESALRQMPVTTSNVKGSTVSLADTSSGVIDKQMEKQLTKFLKSNDQTIQQCGQKISNWVTAILVEIRDYKV